MKYLKENSNFIVPYLVEEDLKKQMQEELIKINEAHWQNITKAMKKGEKSGSKKSRIEIAKRMLEKGKSMEETIKFTSLSEKEINALVDNNKTQ